MTSDTTLTLSLISHTNVGKTTLARTLLRRDIGDVADQAHVTLENTEYTLLEAPGGELLRLWDTPGFGDSARLLKRLRRQSNPIGWLLNETWDRFVNRPLWCSQQAVANVRDEADVVLYLVNASEDPDSAGYVGPEMQVLDWIGKPVILVLNQTGEDGQQQAQESDESRWRQQVEQFDIVKDAISLDAFARCWVQEGVLVERIGKMLPDEKQPVITALLDAWLERNRLVFSNSIEHLCDHLFKVASDSEEITKQTPRKLAQDKLANRLEVSLRSTVDQMIEAHGIEGHSRKAIDSSETDYDTPASEVNAKKAGVVGGIVGGALYGLGADLVTGGLTFGGGAVVGAILGGLGALGLVSGYNKLMVAEDQQVRWTPAAIDRAAADVLLCYLRVAHFGRGRGEWNDPGHRKLWEKVVQQQLRTHETKLHNIWTSSRNGDGSNKQLQGVLAATARESLLELYPGVERFLD